MISQISCKNCGTRVAVPGNRNDFRCDSCNFWHWGYVTVVDLPLTDKEKLELLYLKQVAELDRAEILFLEDKKLEKLQGAQKPLSESSGAINVLEETPSRSTQKSKRPAEKPIDKQPSGRTSESSDSKNRPAGEVVGWLVVKTEGKESREYALFEGSNRIGRKTESDAPDIPVEADSYTSRSHAEIMIEKKNNGDYQYFIFDGSDNRQQRPSLNGTYLNGQSDRIPPNTKINLKDGTTIQTGLTKLVFKALAKEKTTEEIFTEAIQQDYERTISVKDFQRKTDH